MTTPAYFGMSDEEFLKALPPEEGAVATQDVDTGTTEEVADVVADTAGSDVVVDPALAETTTDVELDDLGEPLVETVVKKPVKVAETVVDPAAAKTTEVKTDVVDPAVAAKEIPEKVAEPAAPTDYEGFYKKIMAPFKANGKMIDLKSPEEAVQLMQMGANYTRKMQDIVPHRKALMMLENNGLLDEGKLAYLIDLDKKNPEAIKKLIKESGIDPLEIDTTVASTYREGNHRVTDEEANFHTALNDMKSNQSGMETLQSINATWDHASKDLLMKSPEVMGIIQQQRESGIYGRIVAEMDRQKTLGTIAQTTPFLQSYKTVGDQLVQANAFADIVPKVAVPVTSTVVTTRTAAVKPVVANSEKAKAASSTRTSAGTQKGFVNPLAMSDDAFLKHMAGKL
jgi:hypothetical protein